MESPRDPLPAYVSAETGPRGPLTAGAHLDQCAECRRVFAELGDVNVC
jgi:hypothetical protein